MTAFCLFCFPLSLGRFCNWQIVFSSCFSTFSVFLFFRRFVGRLSLPLSLGYRGALAVKLSQAINIDSISIEHAPRELLLNGGMSALKDFLVIGELN